MSRPWSQRCCRCGHHGTKLDKVSAATFDSRWLTCLMCQNESSSLGPPVKVPKPVGMRRLDVYALYMYLQHTLGLVRDTGVSLDQDTSLYSLYCCSNVTICRNQRSSRSILNKYIFTLNSTSWFQTNAATQLFPLPPPPYRRVELLCHSLGYVCCCVCPCAVTLLAMH